jgi:hypothetical protein
MRELHAHFCTSGSRILAPSEQYQLLRGTGLTEKNMES